MRGAYGITSHLLENPHLANECSLVDGGAERAKVVMEAYPFKFARHAVQSESMLGVDTDGADAQTL